MPAVNECELLREASNQTARRPNGVPFFCTDWLFAAALAEMQLP